MLVKDTFHLEGGTIAFVGSLESAVTSIPPCECEIVVNGEVKASLEIDGEMILKGKQVSDRAISTSQQIDLAGYGIGRSGFTIRSKA